MPRSEPILKSPAEKSLVRSEIAPRTIGLVLAAAAGVWLLRELWVILLLVVVALIFAGTLNPLVEWMERRGLKRTLSLILLFLGSVVGASLLVFLTVPPLVEQLTLIVHGAPEHRAQLVALLEKRGLTGPPANAVRNAGLEQVSADIE